MKVFLSWSGNRSKAVAEALHGWLPQVIQSVEPWISADIEKGTRWSQEIANELEASRIGIICLTADNLTAPWLLFESGAIAKTKDALVCTFLLDVKPSTVEPPLSQFQHTSFHEDDVRKLVETINRKADAAGDKPLSAERLEAAFKTWWPRLDDRLKAVIAKAAATAIAPKIRDDRDLLEEILETVRSIQRARIRIERPRFAYAIKIADSKDWTTEQRDELVQSIVPNVPTADRVMVNGPGEDVRVEVWTRIDVSDVLQRLAPSGARVVRLRVKTEYR